MNSSLLTADDVLERARCLAGYQLCDACLGRQFAQISHGLDNQERGETIREALGAAVIPPVDCWLCDGLMSELEAFVDLVTAALAPYEYATFLIGSRIEDAIEVQEAELAAITGTSEQTKREINREIGKRLEKRMNATVDFDHPDITAIVDTQYGDIDLDIRPLFISGRYKKLVRGIPQTKWWCRKCHGTGCNYCGGTGKMYEESVEEYIATPAVKATVAADESFHGAGREDIDVRMLGTGRPFILELIKPHRRVIDLIELQTAINTHGAGKVEVLQLRFTERSLIEHIKSARWTKMYRAVVKISDRGKLNEAVTALRNCSISQRTPSRVVHRRADKIRRRCILDIQIEEITSDLVILVIHAESGTYIKELITGDGGRTAPSLQQLVGCPIEMQTLDVIHIGDEDGEKIEGI